MKFEFRPRDPSIAVQRSWQRQAALTPGTHYADPSKNLPMTPDSTSVAKVTDWKEKFPKSQWAERALNPKGETPITPYFAASGATPAMGKNDILGTTAAPLTGYWANMAEKLPAPPVSVMANPPSASEVWQKAALTKRKVGQGTLIPTPSTGGGTIISPFGFASSSRPNAKTALKFGGYG